AHGRARGPGRLRWRLLHAHPPHQAAHRHGQARPRLRVADRPGPEDPCAVRVDRRHRAGTGYVGRGRGRGDLRAARRPERLRLRLRPGLPAGPPHAAGAADGAALGRGGCRLARPGRLQQPAV
ncbi:MAG: hypothetical protein AVDCRST_MAG48-3863, partial [uncultured Friedmanniella sp.]